LFWSHKSFLLFARPDCILLNPPYTCPSAFRLLRGGSRRSGKGDLGGYYLPPARRRSFQNLLANPAKAGARNGPQPSLRDFAAAFGTLGIAAHSGLSSLRPATQPGDLSIQEKFFQSDGLINFVRRHLIDPF
jgi:hypothetical protein